MSGVNETLLVEKARLKEQAVRLNTIEVGAGVKKNYPRPDRINVLVVGGSGTGKSTFVNFASSFLKHAEGQEGWGYREVARAAPSERGQVSTALVWHEVNKLIVISDTRGYLELTAQVRENYRRLAESHKDRVVPMLEIENKKLQVEGSFWEGANASHHAVLFFVSATNSIGPFDRAVHTVVAQALYELQKAGFQPLIVISKADLAQSPERLQEYKRAVVKFMQDWRMEVRTFLGKKTRSLYIEENHVMCISNVCNNQQWYRASLTTDSKLAFYRQGTAVLDVLEQATYYGNQYICKHPPVGAAALAFTITISGLVNRRVDKKEKAAAAKAAATTSAANTSASTDTDRSSNSSFFSETKDDGDTA